MQTHQHRQRGERRLPTPIWARNDRELLNLLVRFMERRAGLRESGSGSLAERLARAARARKRSVPALKKTLKKLCDKYVQLRAPKRRRRIATQIRNLDSTICLIRRAEAALILRVIYLYFRAELDSVGVSQEVGIRPPAVRQILYKLNKLWEKEFCA